MMTRNDHKFIVYKSSAGSGKTFTLVKEYLRIVLHNPELFRRVLAVTFTNKAANELKERVIRYLVVLADPGKYPDNEAVKFLLPRLEEQLQMTGDQISQRSAMVLHLIMHKYSEFAISTIDSFTHRIIRTFAFDLKIPMNFEVELDGDALLAESVDLLISQVGVEEKLTKLLIDFIEKKAGDEQSWHIENDLLKFSHALLDEDSIEPVAELRKYDTETFIKVRARILQWKTGFEDYLSKTASGISVKLNQAGITDEAIHGKSKGVASFLRNLAAGKFDKLNPNTYVRPALESGEWLGKSAGPAMRAAFNSISTEIVPSGRKLLERIDAEKENYALSRILLFHLFSTGLLIEIEKILDSLCKEDNKLLISEFNRRISGIVRDQPAPFIYERLGEKYHHFLLDEFQDTSVLQWHNLLPLIENSLASARLNLLVGDSKQAIYRWRNGDAEQFDKLPRLIVKQTSPVLLDRENTLVREYREESLADNHRSSPVIVDFNNHFFETIQPLLPEKYGGLYRHARQQASKKSKPGLVRIETAAAEEDGKSYEEVMHDRILEVIRELEEDHYRLSDVAILCRSNKHASRIAEFLISREVSVISAESLLLTQSENVNFLVAWILHLNDRTTDIPIAHILEFLRKRGFLQTGDLEVVFSVDRAEKSEEHHARQRLTKFTDIIVRVFPGFDFTSLKRLELFGLTQYLIDFFNLNRNRDSYIRFFQDAVMKFMGSYKGGLQEFLDWWDTESQKASVVIPEGLDAIRIMTIHKAKGLQFPVVIFPFADEQVRPSRKNIWVPLGQDFAKPLTSAYLPVQNSLAETIYSGLFIDEMDRSHIDMVNLLYVAMTRPEERLYVITKPLPEKTDRVNSIPKLFSAYFQAEGSWEKERESYQYGERWERAVSGEPGREILPTAMSEVKGRRSLKLLLRRQAPQVWDMENPGRNREWGNLVHLALSGISYASDADAVLNDMLVQGLISPGQQSEMTGLLKNLFNRPEIAHFFSPAFQVRNEPEILSDKGLIFRPDRILLQGSNVTILDYKTGKQRDSHKKQLSQYIDLLKNMDYNVQGAYLLYLDPDPILVQVV